MSDADRAEVAAASARAAPLDFELLLGRSPNPYVVFDPARVIVWMNEAYLQATMSRREDIIGRPLFEAFPADPASESFRLLDRSLGRVLETGERDEIALIRYDIRNPDGSMDELYWSATHTPLPDAEGRVAYILQHTVNVTELHNLRRERDEMGLIERAQAIQARNRDLREESDRLRGLFEQAPGFVAILSGPDHRFVLANQAYRTLVGRRDVVGKPLAEALPEVIEQGFAGLLDGVRTSGQAYVGRRERVLLENGQLGDTGEPYYLDFIYQPIFGPGGEVTGIFVQGQDVTEQVAAEERQALMINELNHRVKNTLSIVQGLATQSFRSIEGSQGAQRTFNSRLRALAAAHSVLTERNWEAGPLAETLANAVEATAGEDARRIHLSGPDITLRPQVAVSLAMIVHELSTNAIKYGALSEEGGEVTVDWTIERAGEAARVTIRWQESGGPAVETPGRSGFGTRLIEHGLASEGGDVTLDYAPDGLRCVLAFDVEERAP